MSQKVPTKQRILETALRLFNEQGYGRVTTATLAKEVGIAEGNLWYHFNDKASLLKALSADYSESVRERLKMRPTGGAILPEYMGFFRRMADELTTYIFLYRDHADYGPQVEDIAASIPELYRRSAQQYREYFLEMRKQEFLDLTDAELENVVAGLMIIFRYYTEFAITADLAEKEDLWAIRRVFGIHMRLFEDRLTPEAKGFLRRELRLAELPEKIM